MNTTKRSFLTSLVSLILCFTMFLGTTFAWFTDLVVSKDNVIESGKLDAEMYWSDDFLAADDNGWKQVKENKPIFTYNKWEPGYTEVKYIKVANEGNLNFKWKLTIEAEGEVTDLSDVIDVYYVNPVTAELTKTALADLTPDGTLTDVLENKTGETGDLTSGTSTVLAIAFHMDELADNNYQGKKLCEKGFSVKLVATQATGESDSFDDQYDEQAQWPDGIVIGNTASAPAENVGGILGADAFMTSADGKISANVPAGTKLESGASQLTLNVANMDKSKANITLDENEASLSIDVHILGVAKDNDVVMQIYVKELLPVGLNIGNYRFYHVENRQTVEMTLLADGATPVHNNYEYDPATGDVVLYLASFSEVALVADNESKWEGNFDYEWYDADATELTIANADQLAAFGAIVGGMDGQTRDSFEDKTVKLIADINLGDNESENNPDLIFYPIGYYNNEGTYEKTGTAITSSVSGFKGTFDGNGNTISNFYQNTWEMKGDDSYYAATEQRYNDAMGLFGYVYSGTVKNLTVANFSSDGEFTPTGVIAAYAAGDATFENIAIVDCNPRVYNTGNGGIIGIAGSTTTADDDHITLKNITVDNSNKISALWGSYDVACGGLVGMYRGNVDGSGNATGDTISFENCHVSAQIDVYNDVCANYQYYAYRYSGMIIGSIRHNAKNDEGRTIPNMAGISATGCTVNYGDWNDYYYCEFEKNGHPSYSGPDDYKFSRIPHSELNFTDSNSNGVVDADERDSVTGCKHDHTDVEDNRAVFLPFYQLFTGYSWGVSSIGLKEYSGIVTDLGITEGEQQESVEKFEGNVNTLVDYTDYKLGDIFAYLDNCKVPVVHSALNVSITNLDENNPVSATIKYDNANWENGTITLKGAGSITITIQDYYFCTPTTITVEITSHDHVYDNACDATCNVCQETRTVNHKYDNDCDTVCTLCGRETRPNATHSYSSVVTAPTCTEAGYTTYTCACGDSYIADEVKALGHDYKTTVTAPTCTEDGYTKHTCACGDSYIADKVAALGHKYNSVVTAPTCTEDGYTTYTCHCGDKYVADAVAALGHIETKFTGDFLYRVGNQNAVDLGSLFNVGKHNVTVSGTPVAGNASVTVNGTSLEFNGTGVVKVTLSTGCSCGECELELDLEVVEAYNTTGAQSTYVTDKDGNVTFAGNVVLLNNAGFSSLEVSHGYTFFGNGFTLTCGSDSYAKDFGYSFVTLSDGTLDNVQIVTPNFDYAALYKSNLTSTNNRSYTDSTGTTRYYNARSGVMVSGNSQILNSRISGARAAVNITSGNCVIDNSRLEGGAVATLLVGAANSVTLRDVTLVQKPTASTYDSSKTLMGFSVLIVCDSEGNSTPITLEGTLIQNAWVDESDKKYVPSEGQSIIAGVLANAAYKHDVDGDGTADSLNLGFAYMPESVGGKVNATTITDKRTNKTNVPYDYATVSIANGNTYVYSYKYAQNESIPEEFINTATYEANKYGDIITVSYSDTSEGLTTGKSFGTDGWVYELNVDLDKLSGYAIDFSKLSMNVNGVAITDYKVNGNAKPTSPVEVTAGGVTYTLTATVNGKEYTAYYKVTGTETTKESPSLIASDYQAALLVGEDGGTFGTDTWHGAAPVLQGIQIKYWSVAEKQYKTITLSEYTPSTAGKQNGTNAEWTYTPANGDFTITVKSETYVHTSKQRYAIPVVFNGNLYFVPSQSDGLVNYGNDARTIKINYYFKDNNGGTELKFEHTWSIECPNNSKAYDYSDFCNGTSKTFTIKESCVTPDTLVTLADGTQKRIDEVTYNDQLLVWNFYTGKYDVVSSALIQNHGYGWNTIIKLGFSDSTVTKAVNEHWYFDATLNEFVMITPENASDYIGHEFVKQYGDSYTTVTLTSVETYEEYVEAYSILSAYNYNFITDGIFSLTSPVIETNFFMPFEVGENMTFDEEKMAEDIAEYGLYEYADFEGKIPYEVFEALNIKYLKVAVGKGLITYEQIIELLVSEGVIN